MPARPLNDLLAIASLGGGLDIDASGMAVADLLNLASSYRSSSALLILRNVSGFSAGDLGSIASASVGSVIFVDP